MSSALCFLSFFFLFFSTRHLSFDYTSFFLSFFLLNAPFSVLSLLLSFFPSFCLTSPLPHSLLLLFHYSFFLTEFLYFSVISSFLVFNIFILTSFFFLVFFVLSIPAISTFFSFFHFNFFNSLLFTHTVFSPDSCNYGDKQSGSQHHRLHPLEHCDFSSCKS